LGAGSVLAPCKADELPMLEAQAALLEPISALLLRVPLLLAAVAKRRLLRAVTIHVTSLAAMAAWARRRCTSTAAAAARSVATHVPTSTTCTASTTYVTGDFQY